MSNLSRELEIIPMSTRQWRRVEQGLFDKLDEEEVTCKSPVLVDVRRRAPWRAALALTVTGAVAASLALVLLGGDSPDSPTMQTSRIVTSESSSHFDFAGLSLDVAPASALVVSGTDNSGVVVVLERGAARFTVEPRGERPPFTVQSGSVRIEVVGTVFSVLRDGDSTRIAVSEGTVRVLDAGDTSLVRAGERWPATAISSVGDDDIELIIDEGDEIVRRRNRRKSGKADVVTPPAAALPPPRSKELYKAAERLEATNPGAAIRGYRAAAAGDGSWAANALFAQARLEFERGNTTTAAELLRRYLRRYPNGANRKDANKLLERLR